jgi:hypothetical protein
MSGEDLVAMAPPKPEGPGLEGLRIQPMGRLSSFSAQNVAWRMTTRC